MHIVCTHDYVYPWGAITNDVFIFLRQTPAHHNATAVLRVFPRFEVAQSAVQLVVGILANAAGVQHHEVSIVIRVRTRHAIGL
jgi:hypothetical protein